MSDSLQWLLDPLGFIKELAASSGPHQHDWFRCYRQKGPEADVFDCACGARKIRYVAAPGEPEISREIIDPPGGAPANCLLKIEAEHTLLNARGDPMGLALHLLTEQHSNG